MKILVNDQLIEYKDEGSGRVLLLLHGWGVDSTIFDKLTCDLAKKFRVIRFDFPGFGQSLKPNFDWNVDDYARMTRDFITKLKINEVYATIGHSFGGRIIIKGISQGYLHPKKVVLMGSAGVKPKSTVKKRIYYVIAKAGKIVSFLPGLKKIQSKLRKSLYYLVGSNDYVQSGQMKQIFINTINEDLLPEVSKIFQPTHLIWGIEDKETPISDAQKILQRLKNGHLSVVQGAGHFVFVDKFDEVKKELGKFL